MTFPEILFIRGRSEKLNLGYRIYRREKNMDYKKGKKELGIYYANLLVSIADEISAKNTGKGKTGIQGIFSALQKRGTVRRNMTYLVTHWVYRLSLFTPWEEEELWAVDMAREVFSCPVILPTCSRKNIFRIRKIEGEPEKRLEAILRQLTDSDKDQFMKAFWLELVTMKKEKQQVLTEFLLEWLWVACGKEQAMERIRYWASSYCLPFA